MVVNSVNLKIIANFMTFDLKRLYLKLQQIDVVEIMNSMLSHFKLPKFFWGEAMRTSIDLIKLSPSIPLKGNVPEIVWI